MKICLIVCLLALSACSAQYSRNLVSRSLSDLGLANETSYTRNANWVLGASSTITLVPIVETSRSMHPRASYELNLALLESFQRYFHYSHLASESVSEDFQSVVASMSYSSSDFVVFAKLISVEDNLNTRAELYEGKSLHKERNIGLDSVFLQLLLFDVRSEKLLDQINIRGRGAYFSDTEKLPLDLIRSSLDQAVLALSGSPRI